MKKKMSLMGGMRELFKDEAMREAPADRIVAAMKERFGLKIDTARVHTYRYQLRYEAKRQVALAMKHGKKTASGTFRPTVEPGQLAIDDIRKTKDLVGRLGIDRFKELVEIVAS